MPVEQRDSTAQIRAALIAIVALLFVGMIGYALFRAATPGGTPGVTPSDKSKYTAGDAERLAERIADAGPLLLSDVSGNGQKRPIYLAHTGDNPKEGWIAGDAHAPGAPPDCFLSWDADAQRLRSDCSASTFDDAGGYRVDDPAIVKYPTTVNEDGVLQVDMLNPLSSP